MGKTIYDMCGLKKSFVIDKKVKTIKGIPTAKA